MNGRVLTWISVLLMLYEDDDDKSSLVCVV